MSTQGEGRISFRLRSRFSPWRRWFSGHEKQRLFFPRRLSPLFRRLEKIAGETLEHLRGGWRGWHAKIPSLRRFASGRTQTAKKWLESWLRESRRNKDDWTVVELGCPRLLLPGTPRYRALWEAACALRTPAAPLPAAPEAEEFGAHPALRGSHRRLPAFFSSTLVHFSVAAFLFRVPLFLLFGEIVPPQPAETVYQLRPLHLSLYLPALQARGPGGRAGQADRQDRLPALGSSALDPRLVIASLPLRADNRRQTIRQPSSPPEVKIPFELRLPNVVLQSAPAIRRRPLEFRLDVGLRAQSSNARPVVSAVPDAPSNSSAVRMIPAPSLNLFPRLTVALAPPLTPLEAAQVKAPPGRAESGAFLSGQGALENLVVLGVDPSLLSSTLSLPPGNRDGLFSISSAGVQPGSPGGIPGGDPQAGTGGPGAGGEGSTGFEGGSSRGGGGGSGADLPISILGGAPTGSAAAIPDRTLALSASVPTSLVYPVPFTPNPRRPALLVTTGPIGGGGLRVYGILRGGKIYTLYLPMPGKRWVLQYCAGDNSSPEGAKRLPARVAQLDHGLVPPHVEKKFDFHRVPVPADKSDAFIILRGVIRADGSVGELRVHQGVQPVADQAALAAFSRWKFQPALRAGKPAAVEILVGVPATVPESGEKRAANPSGNP